MITECRLIIGKMAAVEKVMKYAIIFLGNDGKRYFVLDRGSITPPSHH